MLNDVFHDIMLNDVFHDIMLNDVFHDIIYKDCVITNSDKNYHEHMNNIVFAMLNYE